jgi:hypothetical protein
LGEEIDMSPMIESLEGRQMFSVSLTPAAPSPVPVPYPVTTVAAADSGKVKTTELTVTKVVDKTSAN